VREQREDREARARGVVVHRGAYAEQRAPASEDALGNEEELALMTLAITGMTMMKGKPGLGGRGKWFVGAGLLIPIGALIYMYS
jgi:hypothetical protein